MLETASGEVCEFPELEIAKIEHGRACATDTSPLHRGALTRCLLNFNRAAHESARRQALDEAGFELVVREPVEASEVVALTDEERDRLVPATHVFASDGRSALRRVVGTPGELVREYAVCGCASGRGTPEPMPAPVDPAYILLQPGETLGPDITYEYDHASVATVRTGADCGRMPPMP